MSYLDLVEWLSDIRYCIILFLPVDGKTKVKVIAGESLGAKAVIDTRTPIMYLDIQVQAGGTFVQDVPEEYNGFAYVWRGSGSFTEDRISVQMGKVKIKKLNLRGGLPYERLTGMLSLLSCSGVEVDEYGLTYGVQDRKPIFLPITYMGKERSYIKKTKQVLSLLCQSIVLNFPKRILSLS